MAVKKVVQMLEAVNYAIVMILKFRHISPEKVTKDEKEV